VLPRDWAEREAMINYVEPSSSTREKKKKGGEERISIIPAPMTANPQGLIRGFLRERLRTARGFFRSPRVSEAVSLSGAAQYNNTESSDINTGPVRYLVVMANKTAVRDPRRTMGAGESPVLSRAFRFSFKPVRQHQPC